MQLKETEYILDRLKREGKPIVLYGTGNGADKIIDICKYKGIEIKAIFASDDFVRDREFRGYKVQSFAEVKKRYPKAIVLVAFGTNRKEVLANIYKIAEENEVLVPSVPVLGGGLFDIAFFEENRRDIERVYDMLADQYSRDLMEDIIHYHISGKLQYLSKYTTAEEDYEKIICPSDKETFIDIGAYRGDTIGEFLAAAKHYSRIVAFEPDAKTFRKLEAACGNMEDILLINAAAHKEDGRLTFINKGGRGSVVMPVGKEVEARSVDSVLGGLRASIIKFDAEGSEMNALLGCKKTIEKYRPKIIMSVYHRNEDIFKLPLKIKSFDSGYKFYLRRRNCIPAWDLLLYAVQE